MSRKILHFLLLAALVGMTSLALADVPTRVGRISATEGQVSMLVGGEEERGNLLNWPVTTDNHVTTAPGARAEFRVGAAAIRLDGDSDITVEQLDEQALRLRLNYGTASVRIQDGLLQGFELLTPQARVVLIEPGQVRVDTERAPDTTVVSVLAGAARVEGGGNALTGRPGRRIEVRGDDILTGPALRDGFDDWVAARDRRDDGVLASRYLPNDMTGYEELERYGTWSDDPEYGAVWMPRGVAVDWVPYRDGRWVWVEPWGWTWVDNAPWGYAPSHYGRWVTIGGRWAWTPGRAVGGTVWAPALVGWVGGSNWSVSFGSYAAPGLGWYPLSPHDRYVPTYRVSREIEHRLEWRHRTRDNWRADHDRRHDGVTVLPRDHFDRQRRVVVGNEHRGRVNYNEVRQAPAAIAPTPSRPQRAEWRGRERDERREARQERIETARPTPAAPVNVQREEPVRERNNWREGRREMVETARPQQVAPIEMQREERPREREGWRDTRREPVADNEQREERGRGGWRERGSRSVISTSPPPAAPAAVMAPPPQPRAQERAERPDFNPGRGRRDSGGQDEGRRQFAQPQAQPQASPPPAPRRETHRRGADKVEEQER